MRGWTGSPLAFLVTLLVAVAAFLVGRELFSWVTHRDAREELIRVRDAAIDAGAEAFVAQERAESLRVRVEGLDSLLAEDVRGLRRYSRIARHRRLPPGLYERYREEYDRYQEHLETRRVWAERWSAEYERLNAAYGRYSAMGDSARVLAERLGDPYYRLPNPMEAAMERGFTPADAAEGG